ncbi:MAG: hypothetical protein LBG65_03970, partial [Puniceicoccales bacterium]|nr:hypothetical protein [Puniceicoccales bacterium]
MKNYSFFLAAASFSAAALAAVPAAHSAVNSYTDLYTENIYDYIRQGGANGNASGQVTLSDLAAGNTQMLRLQSNSVTWGTDYDWNGIGNLMIDGSGGDPSVVHTLTVTGNARLLNLGMNTSKGNTSIRNITIVNTRLVPDVTTLKNTAYGLFWVIEDRNSSYKNIVNFYLSGSTFSDFYSSASYGGTIFGPRSNYIHTFHISGDMDENTPGSGVVFENNRNSNSGGGVIGIEYYANVILSGKQIYRNNTSDGWGGAISVIRGHLATTQDSDILFEGNYMTTFGGAIDVWGHSSSNGSSIPTNLTFNGKTTFYKNYIPESTDSRGARGGAVNIGNQVGSANVIFNGSSEFVGNFVSNTSSTAGSSSGKSIGGAICLYSTSDSAYFNLTFNAPAYFEGNYVYSEKSYACGGAIFYHAYPGSSGRNARTLKIAAGSEFINNYAGSVYASNGADNGWGGAIYIINGTVEIHASPGLDTIFKGNKHKVSFSLDPGTGKYVPVPETGYYNAITFGRPNSSAIDHSYQDGSKLNLLPEFGSAIHFYDPIATHTYNDRYPVTLTLNKSRAGDVIFYEHDSNVQMPINVQAGHLRLEAGAKLGSTSNSKLTVSSGGAVVINTGSILRSSDANINEGGRVLVATEENSPDGSTEAVLQTAKLTFSGGGVGGHGILYVKNSGDALVDLNTTAGTLFFVDAVSAERNSSMNAADVEFRIATQVTGGARLVKTGKGRYMLDNTYASNTYSGGTRVDEGR